MRNQFLITLFLLATLSFTVIVASNKEEDIQEFTEWAESKGALLNFKLISTSNGDYKAVAKKNLAEGESIVSTPVELIISNSEVKEELKIENWPNILPQEPLIVWLIREKNIPSSEWQPYLNILPTLADFQDNPLLWKLEDFEFAQGTGVQEYISKVTNAIRESFTALETILKERKDVLSKKNVFTFENYAWAYLIVRSRSWTVNAGGVPEIILVPVVDSLPHSINAVQGKFEEEFFVVPSTGVTSGSEVFVNFGPTSNYELISSFGTILEDNPKDFVIVHFSLKENLVNSVISPYVFTHNPNFESIHINKNGNLQELITAFRVSSMDFSDIGELSRILGGEGISLQNETRALRGVYYSLKKILARYGNEEEDAALASKIKSPKHAKALALRKGERQILRDALTSIEYSWVEILVKGQVGEDVPL